MILERIEVLLKEINDLNTSDLKEIEALRIKYLSKKGEISQLMADFRNVPAEEKREVGIKINALKEAATEKINSLRQKAETNDNLSDDIDLTRTAAPIKLGTRHPLTIVKNEIINIFGRLGFTLAEGPEVEDDWHVFSSMNFPADHPARDMQDTFFIEQHPDRSPLSELSARDAYTETKPFRPAPTASSTKLKDCMSTRMYRLQT